MMKNKYKELASKQENGYRRESVNTVNSLLYGEGISTEKAKKRRIKLLNKKNAPYFFISPFFILFGVFGLFPLLFSVFLAFQYWDPASGLKAMEFVGLENFLYTITDDWFLESLYNTVWIAVVSSIPMQLIALPLAFFLHTSFGRFRNLFTGIYFLPFITSTVAVTLVFNSMFSRDFGVFNSIIGFLNDLPLLGALITDTPIDWFDRDHIRWSIAFLVWWRFTGWITVLYLAALQTIPKELYEAAEIDGAKKWQQFRYIALPLLKPMMYFTISMNIIFGLQIFEEPFIMVGVDGGSGQMGKTAAMHMYATAFVDSDFGTASAIAWSLFVFIAIVAIINNRIFARSGMEDSHA